MQKFASNIKNRPVLLKEERALVGVVTELVVDTDNGKLMGLMVREGFGKNKVKTLAEKDIVGVGQNFVLIKSYSVLGETDEFVRIKKVVDRGIPIIKNKVQTLSGTYLGKVYDFTLNLNTGKLSKLYVKPKSILSFDQNLIISSKQIISIEKDKITVDDLTVKNKQSKFLPKIEPEAA